jgi:hypothetical protein
MTRQRKFLRSADARLLELAAQFRRLRRRMNVLSVQEDRCRDWEADGPGLRGQDDGDRLGVLAHQGRGLRHDGANPRRAAGKSGDRSLVI